MDQSYSFNWNNVAQEEVIMENGVEEFIPVPHQGFQQLNIFPQKYEVEVISTEPNEVVEEILVEQWEGSCAEVTVGDGQEAIQDSEIPIPMDQDEYISSTPYPCDFCNKRFRKKVKYLRHMAAHKIAQVQSTKQHYKCSTCGIRFARQNDLISHQEIHEVHTRPVNERKVSNFEKGAFVCELCGVAFSMQKALISHMNIHEGDSPLACKQCNQTFWDMGSLEEHWQLIHSSEDAHKASSKKRKKDGTYCCSICGLSFCRQNDLKRHQQNHDIGNEEVENTEIDYTCKLCGVSYNNNYDYELHIEQVHAYECQCMICGEKFVDEASQLEHVREQHPESEVLHVKAKEKTVKPRRRRANAYDEELYGGTNEGKVPGQPFSCRVCGKNFATRSSQQIHLRIHTGERPYGCSFCHKAFTDGGTLRKHERIHTGEKPYACVVCSKAFNQRVVLREHIKSHHSNPDPHNDSSMTPYTCSVCSDMFSTSQDLILHLIHHCDTNTAMKRLPRTGPRKYVSRKQLKPFDHDLIDDESEEETYSVQPGVSPKYEIDMDVRWTNSRSTSSRKRTRLSNIEKGSAKRARRRTEYAQVCSEQEIENNYSNNRSLSNVPRTKTTFTENEHEFNEIEAEDNNENLEQQANYTYRYTIRNNKPSDATSEAVDNLLKLHTENREQFKLTEIEIRETENKDVIEYNKIINTYFDEGLDAHEEIQGEKNAESCENVRETDKKEEYEEQVVYENPEDYVICQEDDVPEETVVATSYEVHPEANGSVVDQNVCLQQEIMDPLLEFAEISMRHANTKSLFKCEMCGAVFLEKGQLMTHVHIHI